METASKWPVELETPRPHMEYKRENDSWANYGLVGMLYRVDETTEGDRLWAGTFIMPLQQTGDNHYTFAVLEEVTGNDYTRYFHTVEVRQGYFRTQVSEMIEKPISAEMRLGVVLAMHTPGTAGLLVERTEENKKERLQKECPFCGCNEGDHKEKS